MKRRAFIKSIVGAASVALVPNLVSGGQVVADSSIQHGVKIGKDAPNYGLWNKKALDKFYSKLDKFYSKGWAEKPKPAEQRITCSDYRIVDIERVPGNPEMLIDHARMKVIYADPRIPVKYVSFDIDSDKQIVDFMPDIHSILRSIEHSV